MTVRTKAALALLFTATFFWALWLGGQFYNLTMSVPVWSSNPPDSMKLFFQQWDQHVKFYFFALVNPWNFLLTWLAWGLTPKGNAAKRFLGWTSLISVLNCGLLVWAIYTIGTAARGALDATMGADAIGKSVALWVPLNLINNVIFVGVIFILHLIALRKFDD